MLNETDIEKIRQVAGEILAQTVMGRVERIILDGLTEKISRQQRAGQEAEKLTQEAQRKTGDFEKRSVELHAQLKELSAEVRDRQSALDVLKAEHAALVPQVEELRKERAEHIARVKRALEQNV